MVASASPPVKPPPRRRAPVSSVPNSGRAAYSQLTPEQRARVRLAETPTHAWELPAARDRVTFASGFSGTWVRYTIRAVAPAGFGAPVLRCDGEHCRGRRCVHVLAVEEVGGLDAARALAATRNPALPPASATPPAVLPPAGILGAPEPRLARPLRPLHFCSYDGCGYAHPERCPDCGAVRLVPDEGDGPCFVCWLRAQGFEPNEAEMARYEYRRRRTAWLDAEPLLYQEALP